MRALLTLIASTFVLACTHASAVEQTRAVPTTQMLDAQCREAIGERRIERFELGEGVSIHVAIGYDLSNTILIHTPEGNVVVVAMTGPARASAAKAALLAEAPGPTKALILTHSHSDHVGGAAVWAPLEQGEDAGEAPVPVWATDAFSEHFYKQYGVFQAAEQRRGKRQFGARVAACDLPCSAIGARIDFESGVGDGVRLPTETFSGQTSIELGGLTIELHEAHGETDDQLFVWLPQYRVLLPGDNVYRTFPNLYTIRGTRPRPVDAWISSLDRMRRLEPELMIGSHTAPIVGAVLVAEILRDYRDVIAFLRASVVRGANAGLGRAEIADAVTLPRALADKPWLRELYGQLDWSALSIYDAELGWFDGNPELLYRPPNAELLGREYALELDAGPAPRLEPQLSDEFLREIPIEVFFDAMPTRLKLELAGEIEERLKLELDDGRSVWVAVRGGVVELAWAQPFPGTPEPFATLTTDSLTWKRIALRLDTAGAAVTGGRLKIDGPLARVKAFFDRFDRGL